MRRERWMQIDKLFHSVLRREPSDRALFLARACNSDISLRVAVEALLGADDKAHGFLEHGPEPSATVLEPGRSVGAYRIEELIGRGGMGEVYRAHDARLSRQVAIKVLPWPSSTQGSQKPEWEEASAHGVGQVATLTFSPEPPTPRSDSGAEQVEQQDGDASARPHPVDDEVKGGVTQSLTLPGRLPLERGAAFDEPLARQESLRRRFESEALLTASVQHPAVVPIYEHGQLPDGRPFYSMKLVTGRSLRELIAERERVGDRMALLPNLIAVAEALAHAHSRGILHRDVKPSNIIIGEFGETVLIDWGVAKNLTPEHESEPVTALDAPDRTGLGAIIGTPAYMSPEQ
ncbi:MAG TPA: serine/threonine-protein kinase, partial [Burkholderiales bacterium]|nr:serine/threonine-protein kinase [Burkholderiales bacterium]